MFYNYHLGNPRVWVQTQLKTSRIKFLWGKSLTLKVLCKFQPEGTEHAFTYILGAQLQGGNDKPEPIIEDSYTLNRETQKPRIGMYNNEHAEYR